MELKIVQQTLNEFGASVVERARLNLKEKNNNASGKLSKSLNYKSKTSKNSITFDFYAEDYWKQLDFGTTGSKSSAKAPKSPYKANAKTQDIDRWVVRKGIKGVRGANGKFTKRKAMVEIITKTINQFGTKETKFFRNAFDDEYKYFDQNVAEKYGLDLEAFLKFSLKDIK